MYTCLAEDKNGNLICNRKFDEEEFNLTQDKNFCLLHCNKDKWEILSKENNSFIEILKRKCLIEDKESESFYLFKNIIFPNLNLCKNSYSKRKEKGYFFDKLENNLDLIFKDCKFSNQVIISNINNFKDIFFIDCKFKKVTIKSQKVINNLHFEDNDFYDDVNFSNLEFNSSFILYDNTFYKSLIINNTLFERIASFSNNDFNDIKINHCTFDKTPKFNDITINKINRETARIIKDSFEKQNNIIEANKYYEIEMKKREEELEKTKSKNFSEWLVFKIHGLTSNHSQDWLLALFWILSLSFGYAFVNCINEYLNTKLDYILIDTFICFSIIFLSVLIVQNKKINNFYLIGIFYLLYGITTSDFTLYYISNHLNPFSIMTEFSDLTFLTLMYKVSIAYLIYQLIISIRQNTRRK